MQPRQLFEIGGDRSTSIPAEIRLGITMAELVDAHADAYLSVDEVTTLIRMLQAAVRDASL